MSWTDDSHRRTRRPSSGPGAPERGVPERSGRITAESMEFERPHVPNVASILATGVGLTRALRASPTASALADELLLALRRLFPGRQFVVRLRARNTHAKVGYTVGTPGLAPFAREELWVSRQGLALLSLSAREAAAQGICVIEDYEPELERDASGFDVPLFDGESIVGVIGVEYDRGMAPCLQDPATVAQLGLQLSGALAEATFDGPTAPADAESMDAIYERTRRLSVPPPPDAPRARERHVIQVEKLATLGQLAAGIVHELNNPLTSISMYSQHLRRRAQANRYGEEEQQIIARIELAADRVLHLTRELMSYARPAPEGFEAVSLEKVMDRALLFCSHLLRSANVEVQSTGTRGLPLVEGSEGQLQQVFVNLVTNACQAMEPRGGRLELRTALLETGHVEVRVIDEGRGVPASDRASIFEPFFTTKPRGAGTGLGLSIVRTIVEQHRGTVEVAEVAEGRGATFVVVLPTAGGRTGVLLPPSG